VRRIEALSVDLRPKGVEKLKHDPSTYRLRSGDYRVIYRVEDSILTVQVVRAGNRRDVYRNLDEL